MKYHYFYQSKENRPCDNWIEATDRNDAYLQLRKRGIKPYKLLGRNPYEWKRWTAIGVLAALVVVLSVIVVREISSDRRESFAFEDRSQIYGDPVLLRELAADGWRSAMGNEGDAWFARHARPGVACDCGSKPIDVVLDTEHVRILLEDGAEVAKMKRLVNGMKREMLDYVNAGGTKADYMALCDERLRTEASIYENVGRELKSLEARFGKEDYAVIAEIWAKKNTLLRSLGLPTVLMPEEVD